MIPSRNVAKLSYNGIMILPCYYDDSIIPKLNPKHSTVVLYICCSFWGAEGGARLMPAARGAMEVLGLPREESETLGLRVWSCGFRVSP